MPAGYARRGDRTVLGKHSAQTLADGRLICNRTLRMYNQEQGALACRRGSCKRAGAEGVAEVSPSELSRESGEAPGGESDLVLSNKMRFGEGSVIYYMLLMD